MHISQFALHDRHTQIRNSNHSSTKPNKVIDRGARTNSFGNINIRAYAYTFASFSDIITTRKYTNVRRFPSQETIHQMAVQTAARELQRSLDALFQYETGINVNK